MSIITTQEEAKRAFDSPQNMRLQRIGRLAMALFVTAFFATFTLWGSNLAWVGPSIMIVCVLLILRIYPQLAPGPWEFPEEPVNAD